jgi:hypothetical protein
MNDPETRLIEDRRRQPTPMLSPYTLKGRRKGFSNQEGFPKEGYVDHYGPALLAVLVLISGLNCLDSLFTLKILHYGGRELNPIVESMIALLGEKFWIWKFAVISFSSIILCLHSQYKGVKIAILLLCFLYIGLIVYQLIGLTIYNL